VPESRFRGPACSGVSTNGETSVVFAACEVIATRCFAASEPAAAPDVSVTVAASTTSTACGAFITYLLRETRHRWGGSASDLATASQEARNRALSKDYEAWLAIDETSESESLRFRILGPIEAEVEGRALDLGGRKQRAVLAALLLRAGQVVPDHRLVDEIWGDSPPASAAHSLEAYVSRLRQALAPHGATLERRGGGYRIGLGRAVLDSRVFEALVDEANQASAAGDDTRAAVLAKEALGLWHGPVLSGIPLQLDGRAEAERLDEFRSRALEIRVDADLALGRQAELVGELSRLVKESPYRERLVAQLMVALYRSGRQAEALEIYERTRRALDDDLGLQPSEELQRLAGQIVRQEPQLRTPARALEAAEDQRTIRSRARRKSAIALAGALTAAAIALALGLTVLTDAGVPGGGDPTRVALIRMWDPGVAGDDQGWGPFVEGLLKAGRAHELQTDVIDLFPRRPRLGGFEPGSQADVDRLSARLRSGDFDLVLWPLGLPAPGFFEVVPLYPDTRFVFLDYCCVKDELGAAPNATALALRGDRAAHLAGYLSGLMEARRSRPERGRHMVSIIVGERYFPQEQAWARGFSAGARRALPGVSVRVDYSEEYDNKKVCERIANRQVDAGSGVVFAAAGDCGLGALSAAAIRGVWGVAGDEDRSHLGQHVLASATKRFDRLVELSVSWYLEGRLPPGEDVELGLSEDAVAIVGISPSVPDDIRRKVAQEAARLREEEAVKKQQRG
jgi:DNA-binding SARP family transcriptional activator/basic membrane lipoprotein Med (substrate-binding protein (PBP1-ABC) superfamily)